MNESYQVIRQILFTHSWDSLISLNEVIVTARKARGARRASLYGCTVAGPFLLMQPGMGAGIAVSRTPLPRGRVFEASYRTFIGGLHAQNSINYDLG